MKTSVKTVGVCLAVCVVASLCGGCTVAYKRTISSDSGTPAPVIMQAEAPSKEIQQLTTEVSRLQAQLEMLNKLKAREAQELGATKSLLEKRLRKEIGSNQVTVQMEERGLVITFLAEVLFDSGKAELREKAFSTLDKIAKILGADGADRDLAVEGYTDNVPIKHSGWESNWELSMARATSVLHYLIDEGGIDPTKMQATGYGEFRPVASNDTPEGQQQNRRVEVVILPKSSVTKVPYGTAPQPAATTSSK